MEQKRVLSHYNWFVLITMKERLGFVVLNSMILLIAFGTMMILSTVIGQQANILDNDFFVGHLLNITIGLALFIVFSQIDYRFYYHLFIPILILGVLLLSLVPIVGFISHGSARWFDLGLFSFQPSEFAKLMFIFFLGAFLVRYKGKISRIWYFFLSLLMTGIIAGLIFIQPDLGTSLVIVVVWLGMYYFSGMRFSEIVAIISASIVMIPGSWFLLKDYQKDRILIFLDPQQDPLGAGYSVLQSIITIGSGNFLGMGWGRGTQSRL